MKKIISFILLFIIIIILTDSVRAASWSDFVITEVLADVKGAEGTYGDINEFVEIYNKSGGSIDVDGWTIGDDDGTDIIRAWDMSIDGEISDVDITTNTTVVPNGAYAVILDNEYAKGGDIAANQPYNFPAGTIILTVSTEDISNGFSESDVTNIYLQDGSIVIVSSWSFCLDTTQADGASVEMVNYSSHNATGNWIVCSTDSQHGSGSGHFSTPGAQNSNYTYGEVEYVSPDAISSLTALTGSSYGTVNLKWIAPGDDGTGGNDVMQYLVKYATFAITSANFSDWNGTYIATYTAASSWTPVSAGQEETGRVVSGLTPGATYYFAVRAKDDAGNWGEWPDYGAYNDGLSSINCAYAKVKIDFITPAAISNLTALKGDFAGTVELKWTAPGDDGAGGGNVSEYLVKYATFQITSGDYDSLYTSTYTAGSDWSPTTAGQEESGRVVSGLVSCNTYYFAVKSKDEEDNWSTWSSDPYSSESNKASAKSQDPHVVISEIGMNYGGSLLKNNDFVELYNPTTSTISLTGWSLQRDSVDGSAGYTPTPTTRVSLSGVIPALGFYLITDKDSDIAVSDNKTKDLTINEDDIVFLVSNNVDVTGVTDTDIVDFVGIGLCTDYEGVGAAPQIESEKSLERKSSLVDTALDLAADGSKEKSGNGCDTNNNTGNFVLQDSPCPQGTASSVEPDTPPSAISSLAAVGAALTQGITLSWASPSGNKYNEVNNSGGYYVVKYASYAIASLSDNTTDWWNSISGTAGDKNSGTRTLTVPAAVNSSESRLIDNLYPYTTYWFAVKVYNSLGLSSEFDDSSFSTVTQASASVKNIQPAVPDGLVVPALTLSAMNISWTANTELDIDNYWLYRSHSQDTVPVSNDFSVVHATVSAGNTYVDNISDKSLYYSYWIKAVDVSGLVSAESLSASSSPDNEPPVITHTHLTNRALGKSCILVEVDVTDNLVVESASVTYRGIGTSSEHVVAEVSSAETYYLSSSLEISKDCMTSSGMEYYITASDRVNVARYPVSGWIRLEVARDKPEQKFMTPSNPEIVFGQDAEEVVITDIRGNEVFKGKKNGSSFIVWNPSENGSIEIESGMYIYKIKTSEGNKYGPVIIAK